MRGQNFSKSYKSDELLAGVLVLLPSLRRTLFCTPSLLIPCSSVFSLSSRSPQLFRPPLLAATPPNRSRLVPIPTRGAAPTRARHRTTRLLSFATPPLTAGRSSVARTSLFFVLAWLSPPQILILTHSTATARAPAQGRTRALTTPGRANAPARTPAVPYLPLGRGSAIPAPSDGRVPSQGLTAPFSWLSPSVDENVRTTTPYH
jgi:hypothetical protein